MIGAVTRVVAATALVLLVAAVPARAEETITARAPNEFAAPVTTIDQGEKVTLRNLDIAGHDVTSRRRSDDGQRLFRSELVAPGESGPVLGTEYLVTGTYPFFCSVHPGMDATLEVTANGAPVPRPDPPRVTVRITSGDLQRVVRRRKLKVRVSSTKANVKLTARAKFGRLGGATVQFDREGTRSVAIALSKRARNKLRDRRSAKVTVTAVATDAAGQTARSTASRTLR
jgi:plastocyanin